MLTRAPPRAGARAPSSGFFSKMSKGWNKRSGTDRHLICIEDPFDTTHDLGRIVDKNSIGVLRSEFERAAKILAEVSDPLPRLFEKYEAKGEPPPPPPKEKGKQHKSDRPKKQQAAAAG